MADETTAPWRRCDTFSHTLPNQHTYDGSLFFGFTPPETLDEVKPFPVRGDDVFVVTYPKAVRYDDVFLVTYPNAGTTWMQEIVWLITHAADVQTANQQPIYFRSPFLEFKDEILEEIGLDIAAAMTSPRVIKTHLAHRMMPSGIADSNCKIVLMLRNPKDVCTSYYHFYRASSSFGNYTGSWEEFVEMFLVGHVSSGSWFEHTRDWWKQRDNPNIIVLFFEDLKQDLRAGIQDLAKFLGYDLSDAAIDSIANHCTFDSMSRNTMVNHDDVYSINKQVSPFLRKGCVGDWKRHFTVAQSDLMDYIYEQYFGGSGLTFQYSPVKTVK